jgi:hypothetical protein
MNALPAQPGLAARPPSPTIPKNPRWLRWLLIAGLVWAHLGLGFSLLSDRSPHNLTLAISIEASGLYTLLLFFTRRMWLPWLTRRPVAGATALGIFNAAVIEALFLGVQTVLGAEGVAANPNLLIDWLLTMPWYIGMVWIFVRVQRRERYSAAAVLLLGALYESGADGTVGGLVVPGILGAMPNPFMHFIFLFGLAFWQFIPVYSSMVLPPAWVLESEESDPSQFQRSRFLPGLKPLLWLVPYTVYLLIVLIAMAFLGKH